MSNDNDAVPNPELRAYPKRLWGPYLGPNRNFSDIVRLTKAGWLVYDLLAEAGMAPAIDKRSSLRRKIAA